MGSRGRVLIPKALRDTLNLEPGVEVEISLVDGRLEIDPIGPWSAEDIGKDAVDRVKR